jgi:uncharacterized protein (DUF2252 family)
MASDLSDGPRSGLHVQLCGDAHLSNFGAYAAPDRRLVFSVNDFDETLPGPFEWDVKRLVASFAVAGRDRGFDAKTRAGINEEVSAAYREGMAAAKGRDPLFLQAKEAQASVLEPFAGKSEFGNHGQRVVERQRLMQAGSDIFLGWIHTD